MKILTKALLFVGLGFYLSSCSKGDASGSLVPMSGKNEIAVANGTTGTLAWDDIYNKDWQYAESYTGWSTSIPKLVYRYGKPTNTQSLGSAKMRFYTDGRYTETTGSTTVTGSFTISGSTLTTTINSKTASYRIMLTLSGVATPPGNDQVFLQPLNTDNLIILGSPLPTTDQSQTITQMVGGKTWKYYSYFQSYQLGTSNLVFSLLAANAISFDLSGTRVKYNTNGTYSETSGDGIWHDGTWSVTGNQLSTTLNGGHTFISTFKVMKPGYWEWVTQDGQTSGVMIPAN